MESHERTVVKCWQLNCGGDMKPRMFGITTHYAVCDRCRFATPAFRSVEHLFMVCGILATMARAKLGGPKV